MFLKKSMLYKTVQENYRLTSKGGFGADHSQFTQIRDKIINKPVFDHGETTRPA